MAPVGTGPAFRAGEPRRLFEVRIFVCCGTDRPHDVAPDGDWLVWIRPRITGVPRIRVVENWGGAVERALDR